MRLALAAAAVAALLPALAHAQGGRPAGGPKQPPSPAPAPQEAQAPAPAFFLCRTADEVCTLGIVTGRNQVAVIFTNAQGAENVEKPIDVLSSDQAGSALDLSANVGRVVLLAGTYEPKLGLIRAELIDVASPVVSTWLKAQIAGGGTTDEPKAARGGKPAPRGKR